MLGGSCQNSPETQPFPTIMELSHEGQMGREGQPQASGRRERECISLFYRGGSKAQKGKVTCYRSHSWRRLSLSLGPALTSLPHLDGPQSQHVLLI